MHESTASASRSNDRAPKSANGLSASPPESATCTEDRPEATTAAPGTDRRRKRRERWRDHRPSRDEQKLLFAVMALVTAGFMCLAPGLGIIKVVLDFLMKIAAHVLGL